MNARVGVSLMLLVALAVTTAVLVSDESIVEPDAAPGAEVASADPLIDMRYRPEARENNLQALVYHPGEVEQVKGFVREFEQAVGGQDPKTSRFRQLIQKGTDRAFLEEALCGTGDRKLPARYGALQVLIVDDAGPSRRVIDLGSVGLLERQDWAKPDDIRRVYASLELVRDKKEDAYLMAVGAITARQEEAAVERVPPWGTDGLFTYWRWDGYATKWAEAKVQALRYIAAMVLLLEAGAAEGGICDRPARPPG